MYSSECIFSLDGSSTTLTLLCLQIKNDLFDSADCFQQFSIGDSWLWDTDRRFRKYQDQYLTDPADCFHINILPFHSFSGFSDSEGHIWMQVPSLELLVDWFTKTEQVSAFKVQKDKLPLSMHSLGTSQQRCLCPTRQSRTVGWIQKCNVWEERRKKKERVKFPLINRTNSVVFILNTNMFKVK